MLAQADCFYPLRPVQDKWRRRLLRFAQIQQNWVTCPTIYHVEAPREYIREEPTLNRLFEHFDGWLKIFMFEPQSYYPFHTDGQRGAVVNMVLNNDNPGLTLFQISDVQNNQFSILSLDYKRNVPYLFNTQVRHNAINNSNVRRYLLTMALGYPKAVSYQDVLDAL